MFIFYEKLSNKPSSNLKLLDEERNTPLNYEAERALLGAILSNNKAFESVEDILTSNDFFADPLHQKIFSYIKKLWRKTEIADLNVIKLFLENDETLENGGIEYLLKITENSLSIINAHHYGKIIRELSQRRQLIDFGTDIVNKSFSPSAEISADTLIENAEQSLYDLTTSGQN